MNPRDSAMSPDAPSAPVDDALNEHHREIENACLEIMSAAYTDDPRELVARWHEVERDLLEHMAAEEQLLFLGYQNVDPHATQGLRDQHGLLRDSAFEIGIAIQLHAVRGDQLREFIDELRDHAAGEDALYCWAQEHLEPDWRLRLLAVVR